MHASTLGAMPPHLRNDIFLKLFPVPIFHRRGRHCRARPCLVGHFVWLPLRKGHRFYSVQFPFALDLGLSFFAFKCLSLMGFWLLPFRPAVLPLHGPWYVANAPMTAVEHAPVPCFARCLLELQSLSLSPPEKEPQRRKTHWILCSGCARVKLV